jgi:hypothetical protein
MCNFGVIERQQQKEFNLINYQAPNPYPQTKTFFSLCSSFTSATESIGKLVLPAQWREPENLNSQILGKLSTNFNLSIDAGYIGTHDGATIDTIQLTPLTEPLNTIEQRRFIIKFNGNGMQYTDALNNYAYDANKLKETVIAFNYRGVGNSKKTPGAFQDLVTDGIAQVQRLLDLGVTPKNITLDGLSLGGGVATMVAYHFHQLGKQIYLWNDRSFASLSKAAAGMLAPTLPGLADDLVNSSCESTLWSVMKSTGWDVDIANAYKAIPSEFKGYMVVAKKSNNSNGDGVISHKASLHKGVRAFEKQTHSETGHKVLAQFNLFGGHNMPRMSLVSKNNIHETAQDLFEQFELKKRM